MVLNGDFEQMIQEQLILAHLGIFLSKIQQKLMQMEIVLTLAVMHM